MDLTVWLDGTKVDFSIVSLHGEADEIHRGDLLCIPHRWWLPLRDEREIHLQWDKNQGILYRLDGNTKKPIAIEIRGNDVGGQHAVVNPLDGLGDEARKDVRCIRISEWSPAIAASVERLDGDSLCIVTTDWISTATACRLPRLPDRIHYLVHDGNSSEGLSDFQAVAQLQRLQLLAIHSLAKVHFDLGWLAERRPLRYLSLRDIAITNSAALSNVPELRTLELSSAKGQEWSALRSCTELRRLTLDGAAWKDLPVIARLPHLRRLRLPRLAADHLEALRSTGSLLELDVTRSQVVDVSSISDLPYLALLRADFSALRTLPRRCTPALRELWIRGTPISEPDVDEFERQNPQCAVIYGWARLLQRHTKNAHRLLIRSGSPGEPGAPVALETEDPVEVRDCLAQLDIDEAASGGHCMCAGFPTIEFWDSQRCLATVGIHHGVGLRWNPYWAGDARLTFESARRFCHWMKERGVIGPWTEFREQEERRLAAERRRTVISAILPAELDHIFERSEYGGLSKKFLATREKADRVVGYCLRILGCDSSSWHLSDDVSHALELATVILPQVGPKAAGRALRREVLDREDRDACYGAARVLFWFGRWDVFDDDSLSEALPVLTMMSLQHPRAENRRLVMSAISQIPGGEELLLMILRGEFEVQSLSIEQDREPTRFVTFKARLPGEPRESSDRALAAWLLARKGMRELLPEIRRLEEHAEGPDQEAYAAARRLLEGTT